MLINANTRIGALLRHQPDALEAIVSISPKFSKLRNPILRKLIAGRASIAMASKMGGCRIDDFYSILLPFGFEIEKDVVTEQELKKGKIEELNEIETMEEIDPVPEFLKQIPRDKIIAMDVRPVIKEGKDPLDIILKKIKSLQADQALEIINSFEPTPLMHLIKKQGFESYAERINEELVHTYFYKVMTKPQDLPVVSTSKQEEWEEALLRFDGKMAKIDVRELEMPMPMHTILEALDLIKEGQALFVYHKRIPVFLLPELEERKFNFRIREISENDVNMLIFRD